MGVEVAVGVAVGVCGVGVGVGVGAAPEMVTGRVALEPLTVNRSVHEEHALDGAHEIGEFASAEVPIDTPFRSHWAAGCGETEMDSESQSW